MHLEVFLNKTPYITSTVLGPTEKKKKATPKQPKTPKLNRDSNTQDCTKQWSIIRLWKYKQTCWIMQWWSLQYCWSKTISLPCKQTTAMMTKLAAGVGMQQYMLKMSSMFSGWDFYMKKYSFMDVDQLKCEAYKEHLPEYTVKKPLSPLALKSSSCICTPGHVKSDLVRKFDTLK